MKDEEWQQKSPIMIFGAWMTEAEMNGQIREPRAMALATSSNEKGLSNRIVLLKSFSENEFSFYTNYESHKGRDLDETQRAAALFYWDPLAKQVRITGPVHRASRGTSEKYWATRPRDSQLSQYVSKQSQKVENRETLERLVKTADAQFDGREIPCPGHWGGYIIKPEQFEFWESRPGRLHDRFRFERRDGRWTCQRLYP